MNLYTAKTILIFLLLLFGLSCMTGVTDSQAHLNMVVKHDDIEKSQKGQELFGRTCAACHNSRGIGGKCPTLVRGAWSPGGANSDQFMFDTIHHGRAGTQMGAFGEILTEEEIYAIIYYLRSESSKIAAEDKLKANEEDDERR